MPPWANTPPWNLLRPALPTSAWALRMWYLTPLSELNSFAHSRQQYFPTRWSPCKTPAFSPQMWDPRVTLWGPEGPSPSQDPHRHDRVGSHSLSGWVSNGWVSGTHESGKRQAPRGKGSPPLQRAPHPKTRSACPLVPTLMSPHGQDNARLTNSWLRLGDGKVYWAGHRGRVSCPMCGSPRN